MYTYKTNNFNEGILETNELKVKFIFRVGNNLNPNRKQKILLDTFKNGKRYIEIYSEHECFSALEMMLNINLHIMSLLIEEWEDSFELSEFNNAVFLNKSGDKINFEFTFIPDIIDSLIRNNEQISKGKSLNELILMSLGINKTVGTYNQIFTI